MARILVTGGAGFIGGFLGRAFAERGDRVDLVDDLSRGRRDRFLEELLARPEVTLLQRDLTRSDAFEGLDRDYTHVFHLAAILGVQKVLERPYDTLRDNAALVERVLAFARGLPGLERLVFASTSEVYAGSLQHLELPIPTPEDTPLALPPLEEPRTAYMLSKLYGEAMVRHAGPPFTIVRPHNVYGPRMGRSHVIPQLLERAHAAPEGGRLEVYSVDHRRTFCFVDDAVEMLLRVATTPACAGAVLNVGSEGPELRIGELAEQILATVGKELRIEPRPPTPGSPARRCPDMGRMRALTGYQARVPLALGLRRTWEWYREMAFEGGERELAL